MNRTCRPLLLCIGLTQGWPLFAAAPAPGDPMAAAPASAYRSAFEHYRGHCDEPLEDWRALNDEAGRIGGHSGIVRGSAHGTHRASQPATSAAAEGQPPVRGAPQAPAGAGHQH